MKILRCAEKMRLRFLQGETLHLHSRYKNTVNLIGRGQLLALQPLDTPATPLSVILELPGHALERLWIPEQEEIRLRPDGLRLGGCNFCFDPATRTYEGRFPPQPAAAARPQQGGGRIFTVLRSMRLPESFFSALTEADQTLSPLSGIPLARSILHRAETAHAADDAPCCARMLCELLGLGGGLTPGGDDFILGVLAACDCAGSSFAQELRPPLAQLVKGNLEKTNRISGEFLRAAADHEYSEPLLHSIRALAGMEPWSGQLERMAAVGHSSGCDTLSGMLWLLQTTKGECIYGDIHGSEKECLL